ncbi:hypothetical protein VDGL01_06947 [Verticillium dahliae]
MGHDGVVGGTTAVTIANYLPPKLIKDPQNPGGQSPPPACPFACLREPEFFPVHLAFLVPTSWAEGLTKERSTPPTQPPALVRGTHNLSPTDQRWIRERGQAGSRSRALANAPDFRAQASSEFPRDLAFNAHGFASSMTPLVQLALAIGGAGTKGWALVRRKTRTPFHSRRSAPFPSPPKSAENPPSHFLHRTASSSAGQCTWSFGRCFLDSERGPKPRRNSRPPPERLQYALFPPTHHLAVTSEYRDISRSHL